MNNGRISRDEYEKVRRNAVLWPQWKKDYVNQHVIISPYTKKI